MPMNNNEFSNSIKTYLPGCTEPLHIGEIVKSGGKNKITEIVFKNQEEALAFTSHNESVNHPINDTLTTTNQENTFQLHLDKDGHFSVQITQEERQNLEMLFEEVNKGMIHEQDGKKFPANQSKEAYDEFEKAYRCYSKAANGGLISANTFAATLLLKKRYPHPNTLVGKSEQELLKIKKDNKYLGSKMFEKAAAKGDSRAQENLAIYHLNERQDYPTALFWFQKCVNNPWRANEGYLKDIQEKFINPVVINCTKMANANNASAQAALANYLYSIKDTKGALHWCEQYAVNPKKDPETSRNIEKIKTEIEKIKTDIEKEAASIYQSNTMSTFFHRTPQKTLTPPAPDPKFLQPITKGPPGKK